jgi:hypothetical protein
MWDSAHDDDEEDEFDEEHEDDYVVESILEQKGTGRHAKWLVKVRLVTQSVRVLSSASLF